MPDEPHYKPPLHVVRGEVVFGPQHLNAVSIVPGGREKTRSRE